MFFFFVSSPCSPSRAGPIVTTSTSETMTDDDQDDDVSFTTSDGEEGDEVPTPSPQQTPRPSGAPRDVATTLPPGASMESSTDTSPLTSSGRDLVITPAPETGTPSVVSVFFVFFFADIYCIFMHVCVCTCARCSRLRNRGSSSSRGCTLFMQGNHYYYDMILIYCTVLVIQRMSGADGWVSVDSLRFSRRGFRDPNR